MINIIRFYEVYCDVEPKRRALEEANSELAAAQNRLTSITSKIKVRNHHICLSLLLLLLLLCNFLDIDAIHSEVNCLLVNKAFTWGCIILIHKILIYIFV